MFLYTVAPIDVGWELLQEFPDSIQKKLNLAIDEGLVDIAIKETDKMLATFHRCLEVARKHGWEGDFKSYAKPRLLCFPNPDNGNIQYGFMWKQGNNGTTFIASPFKLEYLGDEEPVAQFAC